MFRMFEIFESETENDNCEIKKYALHLRLKNCSILADKAPCRRRSQISNNYKQVDLLVHLFYPYTRTWIFK